MKKSILITVSYIAEVEEELLMGNIHDNYLDELDMPLQKHYPFKMKIDDIVFAKWEGTSMEILDSQHNNCVKCTSCGT